MDAKPKRRWFAFSLRTLLLVVTLGCALFGWSLHRVRQRETAIKHLLSTTGVQVFLTSDGYKTKPWKSMPVLWTWLGAQPVSRIILPPGGFDEDDTRGLKTLFPEATVGVY